MTRFLSLAAAAAAGCVVGCTPIGQASLAFNVARAAAIAAHEHAEEVRRIEFERELALGLDYRLMRERAERGDPEQQYRLGLYQQANRDPGSEVWICRAAQQNHSSAQRVLGHWYNEDRSDVDLWPYIGIAPDNRRAWMWYTLSMNNGDPFAEGFREEVESALSSGDLHAARSLVQRWRPSGCGAARARRGDVEDAAVIR